MIVSLILMLVALSLAVMIALENPTMVQVTFHGYAVQGAVGLVRLIALGAGVVLGILLGCPA
jgi:hypothetical protein